MKQTLMTTFLSKLDKLQNAAGKIIPGLPRRYPTELLLNTLGWPKLHDRRTNQAECYGLQKSYMQTSH